jgi:biotin transport system substrate-specific component
MEKTNRKLTTYQLSVTALMAAVMCILGPVSVPIGPIPVSLTNLVIYFSVLLLGTRLGTLSYLVYLLLGAFGLPVFSGYMGGLAKLAGPTGGYLIGFIPMAILSGIFLKKFDGKALPVALGMIAGTLVDYILGTIWFVVLMQCDFLYALGVCVFPFIPGDLVKIVLAVVLGGLLRRRLIQAGLLKEA